MTRVPYSGPLVPGRLDVGVGDWLAVLVSGFDALDFLERSHELAAESVVRSGPGASRTRDAPTAATPRYRDPKSDGLLDAIPSRREDLTGSGAWPPVR